jgi:hypothetical protein
MSNKKNNITKNIKILFSSFSSLLFLLIIIIAYISSIIFYLNNLKKCSCYNELDKNNYSNLNYLILIESILLSFSIILVILFLIGIFFANILQKGGSENINYILYFTAIIPLIIYGFFFYYVYKVHQNLNKIHDCYCSQSKLIYLLYIQCIIMIFGLGYKYYNLYCIIKYF